MEMDSSSNLDVSDSSSNSDGGSSSDGNQSRVLRCGVEDCTYISNRRSNLERHRATMHAPDQVFQCCSLTFNSKADFRTHKLSSHSNGYGCNHCARSFTRRALLKRHMSVHSGKRDYLCQQCAYTSSHKSNLDRHISSVHHKVSKVLGRRARPAKQEKPVEEAPTPDLNTYSCGYCLCSFGSYDGLIKHECVSAAAQLKETLSAAFILAQLKHSPTFYDSASAPKLDVAEYIEITPNIIEIAPNITEITRSITAA